MNEGCPKCSGCTENIISLSTPGAWFKVKIERGRMIVAYDFPPSNGFRTSTKIHFCPMCGKKLEE